MNPITVTIVTICNFVLWRLKAVTMRLVLESFKSLVLWDFLWPFVTNLCLVKSVQNEDGYRKLQKSFCSWLFCVCLWHCLFLYFNRLNVRMVKYTKNHHRQLWQNLKALLFWFMTAILQFAKMKINYEKALYHNDKFPAWISQNQKYL
jgi:hypothetical protein